MQIGIKPTIVHISQTKRRGLGPKGIVLDHLNPGDKIKFKGRNLDGWTIKVQEVDNGIANLQFGNFNTSTVSVFDTRNQQIFDGNKIVGKNSPNLKRGKIITLDELPLQMQTTPDNLRERNIGIVLGDGNGGELKLFVDYSCPSSLNNGNECAIGFVANNCDFNLEGASIIESKNELIIPLV